MTTKAIPKSPLEGLLTCGNCGQTMTVRVSTDSMYTCPSNCGTPDLHASITDQTVIGEVMQTVLTRKNTRTFLDEANKLLEEEAPRERPMTDMDVQDLKENPKVFIQAMRGPESTRDFLGRFIQEIQVHAGRAVILYSMPLPDDSALAGMERQEIELPKTALG